MELYVYKAQVLRIVDGDTFDLLIDLGFDSHLRIRARLADIDTPEIYGVKHSSEEYLRGKSASAFAQDWLEENAKREERLSLGETFTSYHVTIRSQKGNLQGKYGRWIVEIFPGEGGGPSLNEALLKANHAEKLN